MAKNEGALSQDLVAQIEAMRAELAELKAATTPQPVTNQRYSRAEVRQFLEATPPVWQFFSIKAGTSILLHPDRIADRSERGLASEQLPPLKLEFRPWEKYGCEFLDPDRKASQAPIYMNYGVVNLWQIPIISVLPGDREKYGLPDNCQERVTALFKGEPFYTIERVVGMIEQKMKEYTRPEDRLLLMTGDQFRNHIRMQYESQWSIEDVTKRNQERAQSMADDAWKRGIKPEAKASAEAEQSELLEANV